MKPAFVLQCVVTCSECGNAVTGSLSFDLSLKVRDSDGFLIAGLRKLRVVCDRCAKKSGMPMGDEMVTEADLTDPSRRERIVDSLARGLSDG